MCDRCQHVGSCVKLHSASAHKSRFPWISLFAEIEHILVVFWPYFYVKNIATQASTKVLHRNLKTLKMGVDEPWGRLTCKYVGKLAKPIHQPTMTAAIIPRPPWYPTSDAATCDNQPGCYATRLCPKKNYNYFSLFYLLVTTCGGLCVFVLVELTYQHKTQCSPFWMPCRLCALNQA